MRMRRLWGRRSSDEGALSPELSAEPKAGPESEAARPREALAFSLRAWGQFAVEVGDPDALAEIRERFEHWAQAVSCSEAEAPPADYDGVERFVLEHRKHEQRLVGQRAGDMQEALWAFVECFHRSLASDQVADARAQGQLDRLRTALSAGDTKELRREASSVIQLLQSSIDRRQERYQKQVEVLSNKVTRLSRDLVKAQIEASTDPLTGLSNRAAFDAHVAQIAQLGPVLTSPPVLLLMDIDHFKWVNDRFGHPTGDEVVRRLAARLRAELRTRDDFVARIGGDEFAAVLREVEPRAELPISDRLLLAVREMEVDVNGEPVRCSISVGTARLGFGESSSSWVCRADRALYEAKHRGRDRAVSAELTRGDTAEGRAERSSPAIPV